MSDSTAFIVVASNAHLAREIAMIGTAQPMQLRSLASLQKKLEEYPATFVLLEGNIVDSETALQTLNDLRRKFPAFRFAVFCPDWSEQTVADAETLRFLFLESGAVDVFANRRELASLSSIVQRQMCEA